VDRFLTFASLGTLAICMLLLRVQPKAEVESNPSQCDEQTAFESLRDQVTSDPLAASSPVKQAELAARYRRCGQMEEAAEEVLRLLGEYGPDGAWATKHVDDEAARSAAVDAIATALVELADALSTPTGAEASPMEIARAAELYQAFFELFPDGRGVADRRTRFGDLLDLGGRHAQAGQQYSMAALVTDDVAAAERAIARARQVRQNAPPADLGAAEAWGTRVIGAAAALDPCLPARASEGTPGAGADPTEHWRLNGRWLGGWSLGPSVGSPWDDARVSGFRTCAEPLLGAGPALVLVGPKSYVDREADALMVLLSALGESWDGRPLD
jgi:hypothetical protein